MYRLVRSLLWEWILLYFLFYCGFILYNQLVYNVISTIEDIIKKNGIETWEKKPPSTSLYYHFPSRSRGHWRLSWRGGWRGCWGEERAWTKGLGWMNNLEWSSWNLDLIRSDMKGISFINAFYFQWKHHQTTIYSLVLQRDLSVVKCSCLYHGIKVYLRIVVSFWKCLKIQNYKLVISCDLIKIFKEWFCIAENNR